MAYHQFSRFSTNLQHSRTSDLGRSASAQITASASQCNLDGPFSIDIGVIDQIFFRDPEKQNQSTILQALYIRARLQSTILDIFTLLVDSGYIRPENMTHPISLYKADASAQSLLGILKCFEHPRFSNAKYWTRPKSAIPWCHTCPLFARMHCTGWQ